MLSAAVFEELPPLPDCVPLLPSSPVIPSVIEIPDDPEVDELISETNKGIASISGGPLPASFSRVPRSSRSRLNVVLFLSLLTPVLLLHPCFLIRPTV